MAVNVDPQEIAKFSELAHRWWDPESEFRPLHQINPLRLDWIEQLTGGLAGKQVLDVGCGGGILADAMARKGAEVLGIEVATIGAQTLPELLPQGARIDLVATLRAAAPWQPLRRRQTPRPEAALLVRASDIRLKRFRETSDRVLIFAVDASGSAAFARLAEAKGAIELLLAQAYARRDHVALLAFRGAQAELILPPTRSLVQTKRRLAGVPGGGGTPLASALQLALATAAQAKALARCKDRLLVSHDP